MSGKRTTSIIEQNTTFVNKKIKANRKSEETFDWPRESNASELLHVTEVNF